MRLPEPSARARRIALTPLIDVVFILLLFFMLSSSFSREQQIGFATAQSASGPANSEPRRLILTRDGDLRLGERRLPPDSAALAAQLAAWRQADALVTLSAEAEVPVQALVSTLDRLTAAGLSRLQLAASVSP